jgi:SAM-dependent methyltransferase
MQKLSVLMPVYNEARTLTSIIDRVLAAPVPLEIEIVAVDDGSSDDSVEILTKRAADDDRVRVVVQPHNMGKGRAIRTAIEHMTGDVAIVQDADLEYDPGDYPKVLQPILDGHADAVYGSRFAASQERRILLYWHSVGNKLLTALSNMANNINLTDMETCYKAVRADVLTQLRLTSDRFGFEPEITARLAQWGARIYEVPISYHGRTYAEGKNIGWRDGLQALWLILKFRFLDTRPVNGSGRTTLEGLARVPSIARWTLDQFEGLVGDEVLEAGCGIGNITSHLLDRRRLRAVDIDDFYVANLARTYGHLRNVSFERADLEDPDTYGDPGDFDTVLCVNVLEHLDHPDRALAGFHRTLRPGGAALVLVPAHGWLFSAADEALEHRKRYSEPMLRDELLDAGFEVETIRQFNRLGVLGWWVNQKTQRTGISRWQARLFSLLLPFARLLERNDRLPGLSLVAVGRKPQ